MRDAVFVSPTERMRVIAKLNNRGFRVSAMTPMETIAKRVGKAIGMAVPEDRRSAVLMVKGFANQEPAASRTMAEFRPLRISRQMQEAVARAHEWHETGKRLFA